MIVLKEYYTLHIPHGPGHANVRTVAQVTIPAPTIPEGDLPESIWTVDDMFPIPPNLTKCTQDCDVPGHIEVRHKLKFAVSLKNPDGHVSELRASLPIALFISPNVPVSEDGEGILMQPLSDENENSAPPRYDDHIYDRLWEDISNSGWNSPSASGANTPHIRSRRNSGENAEALGMASMDAQRAQLQAGLSALALSQADATNSNGHSASSSYGATSAMDSYFPSRHSGTVTPLGSMTPLPSSNADGTIGFVGLDQAQNWHLSRGASPMDSPLHTPVDPEDKRLTLELNFSDLSKVPSYMTAIRTPLPEDGPTGLPSYADDQVTSAPSSARSSGPPSRASSPPPTSLSRSSSAVQLNSGSRSRSHFFDDAARRLKLMQDRDKK